MRHVLRTTVRLSGVVALTILLSGCLKATQELTLNEDDTVDGTVVFAVNKEFLDLAGVTPDDFLEQLTQGEGPLPSGVEYETSPYEDDEFVGSEFTFSGAPLSAFSGDGGEIAITREGDEFVVAGTLDATSEELDPSGTPGAEQILESFDVRISVTFPGDVSETNGEVDGTTASWTPELGQTTEISARGSAIASGGSGVLPMILIGIAVLVVIVLLLLVLMRRKPQATEPYEPATEGLSGQEPGAVPPPPPVVTEPIGDTTPMGDAPGATPAVPAPGPAGEPETPAPEGSSADAGDTGGDGGGDAGSGSAD